MSKTIYMENFPQDLDYEFAEAIIIDIICENIMIQNLDVIEDHDGSLFALVNLSNDFDAAAVIQRFTEKPFTIQGAKKPLYVGYYKDWATRRQSKEQYPIEMPLPSQITSNISKDVPIKEKSSFAKKGEDNIPSDSLKIIVYDNQDNYELIIDKKWTGNKLKNEVAKNLNLKNSFEIIFAGRAIKTEEVLGELKAKDQKLCNNSRILVTTSVHGGRF